jgi:hypothetical protein
VNDDPNRVSLPGSKRTPLRGASRGDPVDPHEPVTVTLLLRRRSGAQLPNLAEARDSRRGPMSREEFAANYGADPSDVATIRAFAAAHHLEVMQVNLPGRTVSLAGTAAAMSDAFGVELRRYSHPGGTYRGREGEITCRLTSLQSWREYSDLTTARRSGPESGGFRNKRESRRRTSPNHSVCQRSRNFMRFLAT